MAKTAERSSETDITINPLFRQYLAAYEYALQFAKDKVVLDVGCGEGYGTNLLASVAKKAVGIDYSKEALDKASKNYASDKTVFFRNNINHIVLADESFELIVAFQVIEHLARPHILLSKIRDLLKVSGIFLLSTPNKEASIIENPYHYMEYDRETLKRLLDKYFSRVEIYGMRFSQKAARFREKRKTESQNFLKLDPLKLHRLLPVFIRRALFDLVAEKLSKKIYLKDRELTESIAASDYRVSQAEIDLSIDLMAVCRK